MAGFKQSIKYIHRELLRRLPILLCLLALPAFGQKLYYKETKAAKVVYYDPRHEYLVTHLLNCFESASAFLNEIFKYKPDGQLTVLLTDFGDHGHGAAGSVPSNIVLVGIAPFSYTYETTPANERLGWIANHEMVHIVMGDNASAQDRAFRKVFRRVFPSPDDPISMFYSYLSSPRHYSPRWYHEGIAAFMETWMAGGVGRALGGYDEMAFRAMVRDERNIYDMVGLEAEGTAIDFQVGANAYLYGTRFLNYLTRTYGPEKFLQFVSREEGSKGYFAAQFRKVYGVPIHEEWRKWIAAEQAWQKANLAEVRKYPLTEIRRISDKPLGSVSRSYFDPVDQVIYSAIRYPGRLATIAAIGRDTGIRELTDVAGAALYYVTSLAFDPNGRRLFYTTDNNNWRDLNVYDLTTRKARRLIRDCRTGDLVFHSGDGTLWGITHGNGLSSVVRIKPPYQSVDLLYSFPYGTDLFDIDVSPDGKYLTGAIADNAGKQKLVRFETANLLRGDAAYDVLHDFEYSSPENFLHSPDGRHLYGSSYYTGVSNLFRYDLANRKLDAISNAETGLFRPIPMPDGSLVAFEYTAQGFLPAAVPTAPLDDLSAVKYLGQTVIEKHPEMKSWKVPPLSRFNMKEKVVGEGRYQPFRNMRLMSMYPIVQGYKNSAALGMRFDFADPLRLSRAELNLSYSPDSSLAANERFHASLSAQHWNWKLTAYYNNADFYDLFGPTKVSRRGYAAKIEHTRNLIYDTPRTLDLVWSLAGYGGMERLPDYQNVVATYSRFASGRVGLRYARMQRSLGAVDDESGVKWQAGSRANYAGRDFFPQLFANYERAFLLPIRNSSLWVRGSGGQSWGDRNQSFAYFYFGGFGNNFVDRLETSRYREFYSFPGLELNQVAARNFARTQVEWNLPPLRFEQAGKPFLYVNWTRLSLFSTGLLTNFIQSPDRGLYGNLGAQLDFRVVIFTYLNATFSVGYAGASRRNGPTTGEVMVSLKLL